MQKRFKVGGIILAVLAAVIGIVTIKYKKEEISLAGASLAPASQSYYYNFPVNRPIKLIIPTTGLTAERVSKLVSLRSKEQIVVRKTNLYNTWEILPKSGKWASNRTYLLDIGNRMSYGWTTAGSFMLTQTSGQMNLMPETGIKLYFNYPPKNPEKIKEYIEIAPKINFEIVPAKNISQEEKDLAYMLVSSEFKYSQNYEVTIKPGLVSDNGDAITEEQKLFASIGANPYLPQIAWVGEKDSQSQIIQNKKLSVFKYNSEKAIPLSIYQAKEAKLKLYKATPAEAINFLVYKNPNDSIYNWTGNLNGKINVTQKTPAWEKTLQGDDLYKPVILAPETGIGLYVLQAEAEGGGEKVSSQLLINITNIGGIANISATNGIYWASTLDTGSALPNVAIKTYNLKDGAHLIENLIADGNGIARSTSDDVVDMAIMFLGNDTAIIPLNEPWSRIQRHNGYWSSYPGKLPEEVAYIYTDRPIYKPGDTIHAKSIIRADNDANYQIASGSYNLSLTSSLWDSSKTPTWEGTVSPNEFGTASQDIKIPAEIKTGNYYLSIKHGSQSLNNIAIVVDEYRKPLYEASVKANKGTVTEGEEVEFDIRSKYSFGLPVKEKPVEWTIYEKYSHGENDPYAAKYNSWYGEWMWGEYDGTAIASGTVMLNNNGEASVKQKIHLQNPTSGKYDLVMKISQKDEGQSPETASTSFTYYPTEIAVGPAETSQAKDNPFIALKANNRDGSITSGVEITMARGTNEIKQITGNDGKAIFKLNDEKYWGNLTFKWKDKKGNPGEYQTYFKPVEQNTNAIAAKLELPESTETGAMVPAKASGGGKQHLIIWQRGTILDSRVVDDGQNFEFQMTDKMAPNVYINTYSFANGELASTYKEIVPNDLTKFKQLQVSYKLDRERYQPGDTAILTIETKDRNGQPVPAEVSIGVVDKAIYQLKAKAEEPIHPFFYKKRYDNTAYATSLDGLYAWEMGGKGGGGGGGDTTRPIFADTAFYLADAKTNEEGTTTVSFKLPGNITTWMVSGYAVDKKTQVGQAEIELVSTKNAFSMPLLPQFLTAGDVPIFKAILVNNTNNSLPLKSSFAWNSKAPANNPTQSFSLPAFGTTTLSWQMPIEQNIDDGVATILSAGNDGNILDAVTTKVPVMEKGLTVKSSRSGIGPGIIQPEPLPGNLQPQTSSTISVHTSILGFINDALAYEAGYPYGCVEQTMSKFYPTILVKKYLPYLEITNKQINEEMDMMIQDGIGRLAKFQHDDGGWGLWEYDTSKAYYTSYALNGLLDLRESYKVPAGMIENGKKYLENLVAQHALNNSDKFNVLLVLSRLKSPAAASISADIANWNDLDDQQLAEAVLATKSKPGLETLAKRAQMASANQAKWNKGSNSSHFAHENLSTALAVQALMAASPSSDLIEKGLNYINSHRTSAVYGSTYANAQVVKAFVEYTKTHGANSSSYNLTIKQGNNFIFNGVATKDVGPLAINSQLPVEIEQKGNGTLLWEISQTDKLAGKIAAQAGNGLKVFRSYRNTATKNNIQAGDIIQIEITVSNISSASLNNLVINDHLPAGFEAINSALDNETSTYHTYGWSRTVGGAIFFPYYSNSGATNTYRYYARAILPGKYTANPATAELMYTPGIPAWSNSDEITIEE